MIALVDRTRLAARDQQGLGIARRHRNPPAGNERPGMQPAVSWVAIGGIAAGHGGWFFAALLETLAGGDRPNPKQQAREE